MKCNKHASESIWVHMLPCPAVKISFELQNKTKLELRVKSQRIFPSSTKNYLPWIISLDICFTFLPARLQSVHYSCQYWFINLRGVVLTKKYGQTNWRTRWKIWTDKLTDRGIHIYPKTLFAGYKKGSCLIFQTSVLIAQHVMSLCKVYLYNLSFHTLNFYSK